MNCIVTVNINGVLCDNARSSFHCAADRWGVDFVEVRTSQWPVGYHPSFNKLSLSKRLIGYDRVLYLDADVLIRSDAPNIFSETCGSFCCVKDIHTELEFGSPEFKSLISSYMVMPLEYIKNNVDSTLDERSYFWGFFNSGVFLYNSRKLQDIVPETFEVNNPYHHSAHVEQALFNYWVQKSGIDIKYLDRTWNWINPDETSPMKGYIYHFTGD